jgi:hypothetical protein
MKKLVKRKIDEQKNRCGICGELFTDIHDVVPDHKLSFKAYLCRVESIMLPL